MASRADNTGGEEHRTYRALARDAHDRRSWRKEYPLVIHERLHLSRIFGASVTRRMLTFPQNSDEDYPAVCGLTVVEIRV